MADNRLDEAIDIVARHVIARAAEDFTADGWEIYDEIGDDDWHAVVDRVDALSEWPDQAQYEAAYDFLAGRAGGEAL